MSPTGVLNGDSFVVNPFDDHPPLGLGDGDRDKDMGGVAEGVAGTAARG